MANPYADAALSLPDAAANDAPIAKIKGGNPYTQAVESMVSDERTALRGSMLSAQGQNPDQVAQAVKLSRVTGSPYEAIQPNLAEVENGVKLDNYEKMIAGAPATQRFLTHQAAYLSGHDKR
jgi:hypothetical protein